MAEARTSPCSPHSDSPAARNPLRFWLPGPEGSATGLAALPTPWRLLAKGVEGSSDDTVLLPLDLPLDLSLSSACSQKAEGPADPCWGRHSEMGRNGGEGRDGRGGYLAEEVQCRG